MARRIGVCGATATRARPSWKKLATHQKARYSIVMLNGMAGNARSLKIMHIGVSAHAYRTNDHTAAVSGGAGAAVGGATMAGNGMVTVPAASMDWPSVRVRTHDFPPSFETSKGLALQHRPFPPENKLHIVVLRKCNWPPPSANVMTTTPAAAPAPPALVLLPSSIIAPLSAVVRLVALTTRGPSGLCKCDVINATCVLPRSCHILLMLSTQFHLHRRCFGLKDDALGTSRRSKSAANSAAAFGIAAQRELPAPTSLLNVNAQTTAVFKWSARIMLPVTDRTDESL